MPRSPTTVPSFAPGSRRPRRTPASLASWTCHVPTRRPTLVALTALVLSVLTLGFDITILNIALPTIATDLAAGTDTLQRIVNAYVLVFAGLLPLGAIGDPLRAQAAHAGGPGSVRRCPPGGDLGRQRRPGDRRARRWAWAPLS